MSSSCISGSRRMMRSALDTSLPRMLPGCAQRLRCQRGVLGRWAGYRSNQDTWSALPPEPEFDNIAWRKVRSVHEVQDSRVATMRAGAHRRGLAQRLKGGARVAGRPSHRSATILSAQYAQKRPARKAGPMDKGRQGGKAGRPRQDQQAMQHVHSKAGWQGRQRQA